MGHPGGDGDVEVARIPPSSANPPPSTQEQDTEAPKDALYTIEEIDHLLDLLTESADEWFTTLNGQTAAMVYLTWCWEATVERQRERAWQLCKNRLTRLRFVPGGEAEQHRTFLRILDLKNEVDIRRALDVQPAHYTGFKPEAEEPIYERVGGWLGLYMECVKHSQVPLAYHFWMGVLAMSAAARRNIYVEVGADSLWLNQFLFLVGPRASGKSDALKYAKEVLTRMNNQLWDLGPGGIREERYEWQVNFMPEDAGQEHIINELQAISARKVRDEYLRETRQPVDASALLMIDELSVHYGEDNWAVGKKIPFYTTIFGRDSYTKGTVKRGRQQVDNLCFSMTGCSAPEWMRDVISPHILKGGFLDRTTYIYRTHTHRCYDPFERPPVDPLMLDDLALGLTLWAKPPMNLKRAAIFSRDAKDWLHSRYHENRLAEIKALDEGYLMEERVSLTRSMNHILKLATVLSMSDGKFPFVSLDHLTMAFDLLSVEEGYFARFLGEVRKTKFSDNIDRIKDYFRRNDWDIRHRDLFQHFYKTIGDFKVMQTYVDTLLESGQIRRYTEEGTGSRKVDRYKWIGPKMEPKD